ncbi:MAG: SigE family RNA polymerase sigma factor [Solirubrobacteraceae bacterium]
MVGNSRRQESFDDFVRARWEPTVRLAWRLARDPDTAEDLAQEAFSRLWPRWAGLTAEDDPVAYLNRTLVNLFISSKRRKNVLSRLRRERETALPDPSEEVTSRDAIDRALRELPPQQQLVVLLRYSADLTVQDVASALGCSEGTVKTHAARARQRMRHLVEPSFISGEGND